jgi:uncharacterized protein (UPF0332 family)
MSVVSPAQLVAQASRLVSPHGRRPPTQADLRRAISNAYYALYHGIVAAAADQTVGKAHRTTHLYALVYRSIAHRNIRNLCEIIARDPKSPKYLKYVPASGFGDDIAGVAAAVVNLYEMRHQADYDPRFKASSNDAESAIATARTALKQLHDASPQLRRALLFLLLFSGKG